MADNEEPTSGQSSDQPTDAADEAVMGALREHLPLTLIMDLSSPEGPASEEIAEAEGGDADWLPEHPDS